MVASLGAAERSEERLGCDQDSAEGRCDDDGDDKGELGEAALEHAALPYIFFVIADCLKGPVQSCGRLAAPLSLRTLRLTCTCGPTHRPIDCNLGPRVREAEKENTAYTSRALIHFYFGFSGKGNFPPFLKSDRSYTLLQSKTKPDAGTLTLLHDLLTSYWGRGNQLAILES